MSARWSQCSPRTASGETLWSIGSIVNQVSLGLYYTSFSAVLTSAAKDVTGAVTAVIDAAVEDEFPGGQTLVYDASNDGVGIPMPGGEAIAGYLSKETYETVRAVHAQLKAGEITVDTTGAGLIP